MSTSTPDIPDYAYEHADCRAARLAGRAGFDASEVDDIRQELLLHLLRRLHQFDESRASLNTFIDRIMQRHIRTLIRDRARQQCSDHGEPPAQLWVDADSSVQTRRLGVLNRRDADASDVRMDMAHFVDHLPQGLRTAAQLLLCMPAAQAARSLGLSRGMFHYHYVLPLRRLMISAGIDQYRQKV